MDVRQTVYGLVILGVFFAIQAGYLNQIGSAIPLVGIIIFSAVMMLMGKAVMPKPKPDQKILWQFAIIFAVVLTALMSYGQEILGISSLAPSTIFITMWLIIFGGAMILTGRDMKWNITLLTGIVWLFSSFYMLFAGTFMQFGIITSLPFIIYGILPKR